MSFTTFNPTQELALLAGRRAFPKAQILLSGTPTGAPTLMDVGWHGTSVDSETGAFARVQQDAGLDDLIGEIIQVRYANRAAFVYVLGAAAVAYELSLARRAFAALSRLSADPITCEVVSVR